MAARRAQTSRQWEEESGNRIRTRGTDSRSTVAGWREEALRGKDRDVPTLTDLVPQRMPIVRVPMLQIFEVMERLFAVEELDVLRLRRGQSPDRPAQMHE